MNIWRPEKGLSLEEYLGGYKFREWGIFDMAKNLGTGEILGAQ